MAKRVALMRKVAALLEERVYEIAAVLTLEVGENRLEALGEAQECVDFFNVYARLRVAQGLRVRAAERPFERLRFAQQERHAPVRRLGRDRTLQFPDRARRQVQPPPRS